MGHYVLVTLDLPGANSEQRQLFDDALKKVSWTKIGTLTTAWQVAFSESQDRARVVQSIQTQLKKAKDASRISMIEYAIQENTVDLIVGNIR